LDKLSNTPQPITQPITQTITQTITMVNDPCGTLHLEFNHLKRVPFLSHGIFTRLGGKSKTPFGSLNVGLSTGDDKNCVQKNRALISSALGGGTELFLSQVHSDKILVLKKEEMKNDLSLGENLIADAFITDIPEISLVIQVADCQPVILVDPVKRVIANIHSGWKGSVMNIISRSVDTMEKRFGSNPEDILAGIGPSLGPCCAEFINYKSEIPDYLWHYKNDRDHFDFWKLSQDQLTQRGVKPENISHANICTKCSHNIFFSYRHEKVTGRFASVVKIMLDHNIKSKQ